MLRGDAAPNPRGGRKRDFTGHPRWPTAHFLRLPGAQLISNYRRRAVPMVCSETFTGPAVCRLYPLVIRDDRSMRSNRRRMGGDK